SEIDIRTAPIKLRLSKGGLDGIKTGAAIYGDREDALGHLCSRKATEYIETLDDGQKQQGTILERLLVPHLSVSESDGYKRMYMNFGTIHAVNGTEFAANVEELHKICDVLPNGYAVSSDDFVDQAEFQKIVREAST
ncbi:hypothetical protein OSTOST_03952, partial [Ostertagia ostertagi]